MEIGLLGAIFVMLVLIRGDLSEIRDLLAGNTEDDEEESDE